MKKLTRAGMTLLEEDSLIGPDSDITRLPALTFYEQTQSEQAIMQPRSAIPSIKGTSMGTHRPGKSRSDILPGIGRRARPS
jgi:hypothetical protein